MIAARQTLHGGGRKPYDAKVEYLESTGTQYIKTGFIATDSMSCKALISPTGLGLANDGPVFGYRFTDTATAEGNMRFWFIYGDGRIGLRNGIGIQNSTQNLSAGSIYDISVDNDYVRVNSSVWIAAGNRKATMSPPGEMWLFYVNCIGHYNSDIPFSVMARLYAFQIFDNDTLVRDLIPVRVGNVGYMYDKVSGKLFGNSGTGDFVLGPDKKPADTTVSAKSYVQDGLVAMWDGIENAGYGKHDANATEWKSLVGDYTLVPSGSDYLFNRDNFEISNVLTTCVESNSQDFVNLIINGAMTIELCSWRPNYVRPNVTDADIVGLVCISSTHKETTNRMLTLDARVAGGIYSTVGCLQYRQTGWVSESARIPPDKSLLDFANPQCVYLRCYTDKVAIGTHKDGEFYTYATSQGQSNTGALFGLNTYYFPSTRAIAVPSACWKFVRVYNRILTDAEIAHNYAVDKERFGL